MKLYTRPRPADAWRLRPGDQIALNRQGKPFHHEVGYVDATLSGREQWAIVLAAFDHGIGPDNIPQWRIQHSHGENDVKANATVIMRESIEIDPWSYIKGSEK